YRNQIKCFVSHMSSFHGIHSSLLHPYYRVEERQPYRPALLRHNTGAPAVPYLKFASLDLVVNDEACALARGQRKPCCLWFNIASFTPPIPHPLCKLYRGARHKACPLLASVLKFQIR